MQMPISKVPKQYKSPTLRRWRVMEVLSRQGERSLHVWGHDVVNDAGRASSAIKSFDYEAMTATTDSGRVYKLAGAPGNARSGEKAWKSWCSMNGIVVEKDVTDKYFNPDCLFHENGEDSQ
jgi:hypothetical protein